MNENQKDRFISNVLNSALKDVTLKELFDSKLVQLKISTTAALAILGMSSRILKGILDGTQKIFDHTALIKIASLLQEPREKVVKLYFDALEEKHPIVTTCHRMATQRNPRNLRLPRRDLPGCPFFRTGSRSADVLPS